MSDVNIRKAEQSDMRRIVPYIVEFKLDCENLVHDQFYVAEYNGDIAGFGRIKPYENMYELSTIGVLEEYRRNGIGSKLIKHIIDAFPANEIWITTKIPDYFAKLGFKKSMFPPEEIKQKCKRVCMSFDEADDKSDYMVLKKDSL